MKEAPHARFDRRVCQIPRGVDAAGLKIAPRPPIAHFRGGVINHLNPASCPGARLDVGEVAAHDLDAERFQKPGVASRPNQRPDATTRRDEPFGDVAAQHSRGTGDQVERFVVSYAHGVVPIGRRGNARNEPNYGRESTTGMRFEGNSA